jgi:hypothetical protein
MNAKGIAVSATVQNNTSHASSVEQVDATNLNSSQVLIKPLDSKMSFSANVSTTTQDM